MITKEDRILIWMTPLISNDVDCQPVLMLKADVLNITWDYKLRVRIFCWYFNAFVKKKTFGTVWKNIVFLILLASVLTHALWNETFWYCSFLVRPLIWCKTYWSQSEFAKVFAKSLLDHDVYAQIMKMRIVAFIFEYLSTLFSYFNCTFWFYCLVCADKSAVAMCNNTVDCRHFSLILHFFVVEQSVYQLT